MRISPVSRLISPNWVIRRYTAVIPIKEGNIPSTMVAFISGFLARNVKRDIVYAVKIVRNVPRIQLPAATYSVFLNHLG